MGGQVEQQMFTLPELLATLLRSRRRHICSYTVVCRKRVLSASLLSTDRDRCTSYLTASVCIDGFLRLTRPSLLIKYYSPFARTRNAHFFRAMAYAVMRCPSVTFVHSVKTNKSIFENFHRRLATLF